MPPIQFLFKYLYLSFLPVTFSIFFYFSIQKIFSNNNAYYPKGCKYNKIHQTEQYPCIYPSQCLCKEHPVIVYVFEKVFHNFIQKFPLTLILSPYGRELGEK